MTLTDIEQVYIGTDIRKTVNIGKFTLNTKEFALTCVTEAESPDNVAIANSFTLGLENDIKRLLEKDEPGGVKKAMIVEFSVRYQANREKW